MDDPFAQTQTALAPRTFSLDQIIAIWLHEKANRTRSAETERAYAARLKQFRALLHAAGLELNSDVQLVAIAAQAWADHTERVDERGAPLAVAPTTYNQRLAILSSFYQTAIKRGVLTANPIASMLAWACRRSTVFGIRLPMRWRKPAKLSEIRDQLGHASIATTDRYIQKRRREEPPWRDDRADVWL